MPGSLEEPLRSCGRRGSVGPGKIAQRGDKNVLGRRGLLAESEQMLRDVLPLQIAAFGEAHVVVANTRNDLGLVLEGQARDLEAEPYFRASWAGYQEWFGPEHSNPAIIGRGSRADSRGSAPVPQRSRVRATGDPSAGASRPAYAVLGGLSVFPGTFKPDAPRVSPRGPPPPKHERVPPARPSLGRARSHGPPGSVRRRGR